MGTTDIEWDNFSLQLHNSLFVQRFLDREGVMIFLEDEAPLDQVSEVFKVVVYGGTVVRMQLETLEEQGCMFVRLVELKNRQPSFALI